MKRLARVILLLCLMLMLLGSAGTPKAAVQSAPNQRLVVFEGFFEPS